MLVFLDSETLTTGDIDLSSLEGFGAVQLHSTTRPKETAKKIAEASIVITNKVLIDRAAFEAAPKLRLVCVCATGYNNIDLEAAHDHDVTVCNVTGYSTSSVAQHTISLLLSLATNMHRYANEAPVWSLSPVFTRLSYPVIELEDRVLGIAGLGNIGGRVGEIAEALGMEIQVLAREGSITDRHPEWPRVDYETFFSTSDAVTLHCPLNRDTQNMVNDEVFSMMKHDAFLINTGRGGLVDEAALLDALRQDMIAGAGLDVLSVEPPTPRHPLLLANLPNLIITPHSAWTAREARQRLFDRVIENIIAFRSKHPINVVTP